MGTAAVNNGSMRASNNIYKFPYRSVLLMMLWIRGPYHLGQVMEKSSYESLRLVLDLSSPKGANPRIMVSVLKRYYIRIVLP